MTSPEVNRERERSTQTTRSTPRRHATGRRAVRPSARQPELCFRFLATEDYYFFRPKPIDRDGFLRLLASDAGRAVYRRRRPTDPCDARAEVSSESYAAGRRQLGGLERPRLNARC